jgi:hypothetical protein
MTNTVALVGAMLFGAFLASPISAFGDPENIDERTELARAPQNASVRLDEGVSASARHGTPISAKYEINDGRLELSVYTMAADEFWEVIVDHTTGMVRGVGPINRKELNTARSQKEAITKAPFSLEAAIAVAVRAGAGYRAVSAVPSLKDGRLVVTIMLVDGNDWRTAILSLE